MRLPWEERRQLLGELQLGGPHWQTVSYSVGGGAALLAASREHGIEGLIAKRLGARYEPGKRSRSWLKVKNWDQRELVSGGYVPTPAGGIEALLLGELAAGELRYVGRVDFGLRRDLLQALALIACEQPPFVGVQAQRGVHYVEPRLVAEVQCLAGVAGLRHAVLRGIRLDES